MKNIDILIVDDDLTTCTHTTQIFRELNINADYTLYGTEAIRFVRDRQE